MNQENQSSGPQDFRTMLNWITLLFRALAVSVEVFLHRSGSFGERYIGLQGAAVIPLVLIYSLFWEGHDVRPLLGFLPVFLVMCLAARIGVALRRRRGIPEHSYYNGLPWLMKLVPTWKETTVKGIVEPLMVFTLGAFGLALNQPLGSFLMLAAFGQMGCMQLIAGVERMRSLDMNDAMIDQRSLMERSRELRGDWF